MSTRSFLLLQGVASPFFAELEKALNEAGYAALKINYCGGDLLSGRFFSTALKHINYQGSAEGLSKFYQKIYREHNITDIILFGDSRPVHRPAIELASASNINIHVFEEGYFRPHWVTLDFEGVNAYANHSKDPQWYLDEFAKGEHDYPHGQPSGGSLAIRAWHDIRYHLTRALFRPKFPHYKSHRPDSPLREYWGFVRRFPALFLFYKNQSRQKIQKLIASRQAFYLLPLQLNADAQIRLHSPFKDLSEVLETSIASFARFAPANTKLVVKLHPLDPWFINYEKKIEEFCDKYQLARNRVLYLEAGDLSRLLKHCSGTVLVNSTVGTSALSMACPVIALGEALYDIPGLTYQGKLDDFWNNPGRPDMQLFRAFKTILINNTQINGSFYNMRGIRMAVKGSVPRLIHNDKRAKTTNPAVAIEEHSEEANNTLTEKLVQTT